MEQTESFKRFRGTKPAETWQYVFWESVERLDISQDVAYTRTIRVPNVHTLTAFVKNTGITPIKAYLQNSPDGVDFVVDRQTLTLEPGDMGYLVPLIFSKYVRLAATGSAQGKAQVWFQMQQYCSCPQSEY